MEAAGAAQSSVEHLRRTLLPALQVEGPGTLVAHTEAGERRCPKCNMRLWPKAIPRPIRFHDLRHSTATLLLRAGTDVHRVQRVLRHRDVKTTTGTYAHLLTDDLRQSVNMLPAAPPPGHAGAMQESNLWPSAPEGEPERLADDASSCKQLQTKLDSAVAGNGTLHAVARFCLPFHAPDMQASPGGELAQRVIPGCLLTVKEAAKLLRASTVTVYRMCEEGRLPHVRISTHSIRIPAAQLEVFLAGSRGQ